MTRIAEFILAALAAVALTGCDNGRTGFQDLLDSADYYPVKLSGCRTWCMIDKEGNTALSDTFLTAPSAAHDGVFSVYLPDGIAVYRIDGNGNSTIIADGLRYAGTMSAGRMPVCRRDSSIEVIDANGKTVFSAGNVDGRNFNACSSAYTCGLLPVRLADSKLWGAVDRDGHVAIEPMFDFLSFFNDGVALAVSEGQLAIVRESGDFKTIEGDYRMVTGYFINRHTVIERKSDGHRCVLDVDGHIAETGSAMVPVMLCNDGIIVLDNKGTLGLLSFDGNVRIEPGYRQLLMGIGGSTKLLTCVDGRFSLLNSSGKDKADFPEGATKVIPLFGGKVFAVGFGTDAPAYQLLTDKMERLGNLSFTEIEMRLWLNDVILSDRLDDHDMFNTADPGSDLPEWMEPDDESRDNTDE